jgi:putative transposase
MKWYSLKFRTELKRGRIQSFASKHGRKGEGVIEKALSPW